MSEATNSNADQEIEKQQKDLTQRSFVKEIFFEILKEKFVANWRLLLIYLKTTYYVLVSPARLIDDKEDPGLFSYMKYSMATFSVTALVIVIFSFLGVESHSSEKQIFVDEQCETCDAFTHWQVQDSLYVGELKDGRPHGTGVLFLPGDEATGIQDSMIVSGFVDGYLVGTGFKFGDLNNTGSIVQLFDGIKDDGFHKYKPFMALILYVLGLAFYLGFVRYFKKAYRELPPTYLARAAVYHFNAMFFLFVLFMMIISWLETAESAFLILLLFTIHPFYFYVKVGKVRFFSFRFFILGFYSGSVLLGTIIATAGIMFGPAITQEISTYFDL